MNTVSLLLFSYCAYSSLGSKASKRPRVLCIRACYVNMLEISIAAIRTREVLLWEMRKI